MTWRNGTHRWATNLTNEQRAAITAIRRASSGILERAAPSNNRHGIASDGWKVYVFPTTQPARYCELRHYLIDGRIARWVIERDGTVSADNDRGATRELRDVA